MHLIKVKPPGCDLSPAPPAGQMHRRDFVLGGIKVGLSFLALDAFNVPAFAKGVAGVVPPAIDYGLRLIVVYLMTFKPPAGTFPASGGWKMTYNVLEWTGMPGRSALGGNRVTGQYAVTSTPGTAGRAYDLDYAITMFGYESTLRSSMQCSDGPLPALVNWQTDYENHAINPPGPLTKFTEKGTHANGVLEISSVLGTRRIQTDRPVLPQWALLDALRGAKATDPLIPFANTEFDLLFDLTSYRPRQRLKPCGVLNLAIGGHSYTLHGFLQRGQASEPTHYWVDEAGRPLFVTGGLRSSALVSVSAA